MAVVIYNNCSIIPGPIVSFVDESILAGNQERLGTTYRLTITGKMLNYKGSPASTAYGGGASSASWGGWNNQFWIDTGYPPDETNPAPTTLHQLYMIESKQEAIRNLFSTEGAWLEFTSQDGSSPLKCQPKNIVINFAEGTWFNICDYTITAECDVLYLNGQIYNPNAIPDLIQNASETWEIQPAEVVKTFNVSHTVSAVGKRVFTSTDGETQAAWQTARDFVNQRLVLGWTGLSAFSPISGQGIFQQSSLGSGILNFNTYSPYNQSRTETVDEVAGSYSCTESWLTSPTLSGSHIYTVSTRRIVDDPYTNIVSNIQGTIRGFYDGLFNYDQRLQSAEYVWATIAGPTGLLSFITSTYSGVNYNIQPRAGAIDYNYNEGSLNYQYEFSNTLYDGDAFEQWTISRKTSADNYLTSFGLAGTIKGRRYDGDSNVLLPFQRAYTWWVTLSGNNYNTLYNRVLSSTYFPEANTMGVQPSPVSKSIDLNEAEGVVSYSLEWNNRQNDGGVPSDNVMETYQINRHYSLDDGIYVYTIQGEVQGLNVNDHNPQQSKFAAASGYYYGTVVPNVYNRIAQYYNVTLPYQTPFVTEVGSFPIQGQITYSYEFKSIFPPILAGALSEIISVQQENYEGNVQVIANIPIPGRTSGPILQNINTQPVKSRTLSIETVVPPTGGSDIGACIALKPNYDSYITSAVPTNAYTESDSENWQWRYGRYSRQIRWIFE